MTSKETIFATARQIFARFDYDGLRMRRLADLVGLPLSALYHHYPSKDDLLSEVFHKTNKDLGSARQKLPALKTATETLRQRIAFQFTHAEQVVFVLKYYLHFRDDFPKTESGFLPEKSALHIEEVLEQGVVNGEFEVPDILGTAKVIAHAVNGFLLEYYPTPPKGKELDELVSETSNFILRGLVPRRA